jgi:Phosphatidylserine/phosphatidylglycerophosphate/cardiolipin synthases and related enzymes
MTAPLITTTSPYLRLLQKRFLGGSRGLPYSLLFYETPAHRILTTSTPSQEGMTSTKKIQGVTQTRIQSLTLVPYSLPLSSDPVCFFSRHCRYNALEIIEHAILSATTSIVLNTFNLSSERLIQALVLKAQQGVSVTVQYHHMLSNTWFKLCKPNIEIIPLGSKRSLFHKKTLIIDKQRVITGTGNFTIASLHRDVNLMMRVNSPELADLMEKNQKGKVCVGEQTICYRPMNNRLDGNEGKILKEIQKASSSIQLGMCILTNESVIQAINEAAKRSVLVTIIIDPHKKAQTLEMLKSLNSQITLRIVTLPYWMHCKVCIIDHKTVIVGSSNWSIRGLNANKEEVLIINPLTESQKQDLNTWWHFLCENSTAITYEEAENADSSSSEQELS